MLYLIYEEKEKLAEILADNYILMQYRAGGKKTEIKEELLREILKEELEIEDALIIYKNKDKYIPLRYANLDFKMIYDCKNPTKIIDSTEEFIKSEDSRIDFALDLLDYAGLSEENKDKFNEYMNSLKVSSNVNIYLDETDEILDILDLDVTKDVFNNIVENISVEGTYIYVEDLIEIDGTLSIYVKNNSSLVVNVQVELNEKVVKKETIDSNTTKWINLDKIRISDDDILAIRVNKKIIYGR